MKKITIGAVSLLIFYLWITPPIFSGLPCPWQITGIEVGKWYNGEQKSRIWVNGLFPDVENKREQPNWYVNGTKVGHSTRYYHLRTLPNASHLLKPGKNTIRVEFKSPPYNGAETMKIIQNFEWAKIGPGEYRQF